jgi:phosphatidylglycerol lysyltransferase
MDKPPVKKVSNFHIEKWGVHFSALLIFVMGCIDLLSAVQPALHNRLDFLRSYLPLEILHGSRITSALAGFGLVILANGLSRRKRTAWVVALTLLLISIVSHLLKGLDIEESSLSLALFTLLFCLRNSFHAESDPPSIKQGLFTLGATFLFTLAYGTIGFDLLDRHFSVNFNLIDALRQTIVMFTEFYNPGLQPVTGFGKYFADSIYVIGLSTIGFAILMLIRPVLVRQPASIEEHHKAEEIVGKYGRTSLAHAVLFTDKSYFFHTENTVIGYAVRGQGAIVLGDPISPADQTANAIIEFRDFCMHKDWKPAFIATLPDYLNEYQSAGFDSLCIGYEAIVHLETFSLEGSRNKDLRNAVNRMERGQYRSEVHIPPLTSDLLRELREISDAWLTMRKGGEMHFSDGWFDDQEIRNNSVMTVQPSNGKPIAFVNFVPEYQKNEITVDLIRHYPHVEHGVMEFLFTRMLEFAKEKGYDTFSLGLSALVGVGEKPEDPRVEKALHVISEYISRFFNFKGLHNFKEKFHPQWEPRYLIYPGAANLPLLVNSLIQVHSGKNYLRKFL